MTPQQILRWRTRHGFTQAAAGELIGVSSQAWRKWEAGDRTVPVPVERLLRLIDSVPGVREALEHMQ